MVASLHYWYKQKGGIDMLPLLVLSIIFIFLPLTILPFFRYYEKYGRLPGLFGSILLLWNSYTTAGLCDI